MSIPVISDTSDADDATTVVHEPVPSADLPDAPRAFTAFRVDATSAPVLSAALAWNSAGARRRAG